MSLCGCKLVCKRMSVQPESAMSVVTQVSLAKLAKVVGRKEEVAKEIIELLGLMQSSTMLSPHPQGAE